MCVCAESPDRNPSLSSFDTLKSIVSGQTVKFRALSAGSCTGHVHQDVRVAPTSPHERVYLSVAVQVGVIGEHASRLDADLSLEGEGQEVEQVARHELARDGAAQDFERD